MSDLQQTPVDRRGRLLRRAGAVVGGTVAALVLWIIAVPVAGLELQANQAGSVLTVGAPAVVIIGIGSALLGWGLLLLLERFTSNGGRIWAVVALGFLLLSLFGPIAGGIGIGSKVVLSLMHVAVGAVVIPLFLRDSPARQTTSSP